MTYRSWQKSDNAEIEKLEKENFPDPWNGNMLDDCFTLDNFFGFVAVDDQDSVVGYIGCVYAADQADVMNVCVKDEYRRKGIAKTLFDLAAERLKDLNVKTLFLEVRRSNFGAISLYEKLGFLKVGERKNYYQNTEDAIIYALSL